MTCDKKYWAYISYAHINEKAAVKIHRRLESFAVPENLRGKTLGALSVGTHLRPIFRDRDDLSSAGDLSASLDAALQNSSSLVVLCSPAAAKSTWVNQEIERFIALHGSSRIFPLILEGTPHSDDDQECFPPALRCGELEPIAGDMRKSGDGLKDGSLKVVAGILEVPFDSLKQRESLRRQRRLIAVASLAAVIALCTSSLALYAFQQRAHAQNQQQLAEQRRGQAEDLIAFMLGDLRQRLEAVGRLGVLEAVGEEAEKYFAALRPEDVNDKVLASQANALRQIAEIRVKQGQFVEAQEAFHSALEQTNELQKRHPDSNEFLFDLSQAQYWVGYGYYVAREFEKANEFFEKYLHSVEVLVSREPENPDYEVELGYAFSNLGTLAMDQHLPERALESFRRCREIFDELYRDNVDDIALSFEVAATDSWLARVHESMHNYATALNYRQQAVQRHSQISRQSTHMFHWQMEAEALSSLADLNFELGAPGPAMDRQRRVAEIYDQLAEHDPQNLDWKLRSLVHEHRAHWLGYFFSVKGVELLAMRESLTSAAMLANSDSENADWQRMIADIALDTMTIAVLEENTAWMDELHQQHFLDVSVAIDPEKIDAGSLGQILSLRLLESMYLLLTGKTGQARVLASETISPFETSPSVEAQHLQTLSLLQMLAGDRERAVRNQKQLFDGGFSSPEYQAIASLLAN